MVRFLIILVKKLRVYGLKWFVKRLIRELRVPETSLGKCLKPINKFFYGLFAPLFINPFTQREYSKKILYLFYDLEVFPITFDFCWALAIAEMERKKWGLQNVHVVFVPGPEQGVRQEMTEYEQIIDRESRLFRKHHILCTLTRLLASVSGFTVCSNRQEAEFIRRRFAHFQYPKDYHTTFPTIYVLEDGTKETSSDIMALSAPRRALRYVRQWLDAHSLGRQTITISLRQYEFQPARNSNIAAWSELACYLEQLGYHVVVIPDTEVAMEYVNPELTQFDHFLPACWNIELRAALYEQAYLNLGTNNGPFALCYLNKRCRYILYNVSCPEFYTTSVNYLEKLGYVQGKTPAFCMPYQKWIWEPDTFEVLVREFKTMNASLKKANLDVALVTT